MLSRRKESLRELIQHQREESARRHEESERRHEEFLQREEKRKKEFDLYMEKRDEESGDREARLQLLAEKAEAREEETREFNREILLRNEKVYTGMIAEMEESTRQSAGEHAGRSQGPRSTQRPWRSRRLASLVKSRRLGLTPFA